MGRRTRIFFVTDVHGSERCFLKFLNAAKVYKANVLILGGDITGKILVPIVGQGDGSYRARFLGEEVVVKGKELEELIEKVKACGYYPYVTNKEEYEELCSNEKKREKIFNRVMVETLKRWIKTAEEKLKGMDVKCFISPGNDDFYVIDEILRSSDVVKCPDRDVVWIDDKHEMLSLGVSNPTPWNCPRDLPEEEIEKLIEQLAGKVENMENCIFNIHVPPYNSNIDLAPVLDKEGRPVLQPGGGFQTAPVGSVAVRKAIEKYQPLLGLHGHIHEARGFCKIGRTLCLNPGSEYLEGVLRGVLIEIDDKKVKDFLFTSG